MDPPAVKSDLILEQVDITSPRSHSVIVTNLVHVENAQLTDASGIVSNVQKNLISWCTSEFVVSREWKQEPMKWEIVYVRTPLLQQLIPMFKACHNGHHFMATLRSRCGHYIFALWFLLLFFFPHLISAVADWTSTILTHMVWP